MTAAEWKKLRSRIIRRDAYRCRVIDCTVKGTKNLTVHHIVPRDEGGGDHDANLITLCPKHHDEIEIAGVRVVALIEAWENDPPASPENVSRIILDVPEGSKNGRHAQAVKIHLCADSTIAAVNRLKNRTKRAWADLAKQLGYPASFAATLSAISRDVPGAISAEGEDDLRQRIANCNIEPIRIERAIIKTEIAEEKQLQDEARRCSRSTVDQIRAISKNITHSRYPAWVVTAVWDALHNRPMSLKRERRMCAALGLDVQQSNRTGINVSRFQRDRVDAIRKRRGWTWDQVLASIEE